MQKRQHSRVHDFWKLLQEQLRKGARSDFALLTSLLRALNVELMSSVSEVQAFFVVIRFSEPVDDRLVRAGYVVTGTAFDQIAQIGLGLLVTPLSRAHPTDHLPRQLKYDVDIIVQVSDASITVLKNRWAGRNEGTFRTVRDAIGIKNAEIAVDVRGALAQ